MMSTFISEQHMKTMMIRKSCDFAKRIIDAAAHSNLNTLIGADVETFVILKSLDDRQNIQPISVSDEIDENTVIFKPLSESFSKSAKDNKSILMVISRLSPPETYGIVDMTEKESTMWGIFSKEEWNESDDGFGMQAYIFRGDGADVTVEQYQTDGSLKYDFEPTINRMILKSEEDGERINLEDSSVINGIQSISESIKNLISTHKEETKQIFKKYLEILTDATKKYLNTGRDDTIFYSVLTRSTFKKQERNMRRMLWNQSYAVFDTLLSILESTINDFKEAQQDVDQHAFHLSLTVLTAFIKEICKQAKTK